ncbi:hypothetical protein FRC15_000352 [Serendipita sp. 397]|nr:hypothetical protein FRC15_000352 [Serendipita sp. 397]
MADQTRALEFRALSLVDKERSTYGLRYNDFERYRKHCANRVHRLRGTLKMTHGKGKDFKKLPPVDPENLTSTHLQLLLFETERVWAYAQELLEIYVKSNETSDKRRAMSRIRRAQSWGTRLLQQCTVLFESSKLQPSYFLEVVTYELLVKGRFQRIREEFDTGVESLSVARSMLDELAANASTSHDQAIATVFIDEIAPEIRHCAHSLGHKRAYDIDSIVKEVAPRNRQKLVPQYEKIVAGMKEDRYKTAKGGKDTQQMLRNLEWEGEVVPLRNPELVDAFLKIEVASEKLEEKASVQTGKNDASTSQRHTKSRRKVAAFDGILQALSDAETIARKLSEAKRLAGSGGLESSSGGGTGPVTRDIHFVHSFTTYQLLTRRTQRDLLLIEALVSDNSGPEKASNAAAPEDPRVNPAVVKIYDTILQNLNQMRTLTVVDESTDVAAATEARIAYIRAARCLYMAHTYVSLKRYAEAVSLTQTAQIRIREARFQLSLLSTQETAPENRYFPLGEKEIAELENKITKEATKMKVDWFAHSGGATGENATFKKPLFYDIAFNSIEDPLEKIQKRAGRKVSKPAAAPVINQQAAKAQVDDTTTAPEPVNEAPRPSMLGGLLGGWWGRR